MILAALFFAYITLSLANAFAWAAVRLFKGELQKPDGEPDMSLCLRKRRGKYDWPIVGGWIELNDFMRGSR